METWQRGRGAAVWLTANTNSTVLFFFFLWELFPVWSWTFVPSAVCGAWKFISVSYDAYDKNCDYLLYKENGLCFIWLNSQKTLVEIKEVGGCCLETFMVLTLLAERKKQRYEEKGLKRKTCGNYFFKSSWLEKGSLFKVTRKLCISRNTGTDLWELIRYF